jgi:hypothetical protein
MGTCGADNGGVEEDSTVGSRGGERSRTTRSQCLESFPTSI